MREDLIERLNEAWRKLYGDGDEHGVCDTLAEVAAALEAARADAVDAERYRWLKDHDNAFLLSEDVIDDQSAIDRARGKGVGA